MSLSIYEHLGYEPRAHFVPFHQSQKRWSCIVAHRRCGKTYALLYELIMAALKIPNGSFAYVAPLYSQAKDIAWKYLLRFTSTLRTHANVAELYVDLANGSRIKLLGVGNGDGSQIRGQYFHGCLLDEYADMHPSFFSEVIRPTLVDYNGFCVFSGTPKGHNHFYDIYKYACVNPDKWYVDVLRADETGVISEDELAEQRAQMEAHEYRQEYECDFDSAILGAYYSLQLDEMVADGRIIDEPIVSEYLPVHVSMDIGYSDATAMVFFQYQNRAFHYIHCLEGNGQTAEYWARVILDTMKEKNWTLGYVYLPHDSRSKEITSGKSVIENFADAIGPRHCIVVQNHKVRDGINSVRLALMKATIAKNCERLLDVLRSYSHEWDADKRVFKDTPRHDEFSHCADALRYSTMGFNTLAHTDASPFIRMPDRGSKEYLARKAKEDAELLKAEEAILGDVPSDPSERSAYYIRNVEAAALWLKENGFKSVNRYFEKVADKGDKSRKHISDFCIKHKILKQHLELLGSL